MLPCLYYALKYLNDRCEKGEWNNLNINNKDHSLHRFFAGMGYDVGQLQDKKGGEIFGFLNTLFKDSPGPLQSLYEKSKNYFTSSSHSPVPSPDSPPQTVRDMLLWLYGLRFHKHFSDLVENCKSLCLPFGNSFHPDAFCYYIHLSCFLVPVSVISFIQLPDGSPSFLPSHSDWQNFCYPEDPSELLEKFCDLVRKIYIPLHFLKFQCERNPDQAGWQECFFGQNCSVDSGSGSSSTSGCKCDNKDKYLCTGSSGHSGKCSAASSSGSCSSSCPHHLVRFLIDDFSESQSKSKPQSQSPSSLFRLPFSFARLDFSQTPPVILPSSDKDFLTMGFSPDKLSSTAKSGYSLLHGVLHVFCREDGFYPLTRLLQFSLCVSRYPETLGELFAFFFRFSESDVFKNFGDYVDGEPGSYRGKALQDALETLVGSKTSHSTSHPSDLRSLIACDGPKGSSNPTCGKYLHPLTYNAYHGFIEGFLGTYLSWICHLAPTFKENLESFHTAAKGKLSSSSCCTSCQKIVECPCALPFLYSFGFGFWSPKGLNCESHGSGQHTKGKEGECTRKTCQNFVTQLRLVAEGDPFKKLLEEIEKFLWSIRFPFFFAFLYVWFFVLSYFCYVILIKLDTFHTGSHLHLPRSFKILPSTLFSDASSKLKDLSYFTL